jgi:succinyl-diaminopimelate desuccinylase
MVAFITVKNEIDLLTKLVRMPTITDDTVANEKALDYLEGYFGARGLFCERYKFNGHGAMLAASRPYNTKHPIVLLAAHMDVVNGTEELFSLREEDGKLYGRGVYDMKFAISGYMQLAEDLRHKAGEYDFAIMITTDEEYGGRDGINGSLSLIEERLRPRVCVLPGASAPGWDVEKLAKGYWRFDLLASGQSAHSSRPWEGESASFKLIDGVSEIRAYFKNHGPLTDTLNIAAINGGEMYNRIPENMVSHLEIRFMNSESLNNLREIIDEICSRHGLVYRNRAIFMPVVTDLRDAYVESYSQSVQDITHHHSNGVISYGGSDSTFFSELGIPCIISCPEGGKHHSSDEWIDTKSYLQFVPILRSFLDRVAKKSPRPDDMATSHDSR